MRRIELPGIGIETSALGFGCASLGSRVSARAGLDALARAFDAGVTWYDLAPAYGAGEAETIFADFLAARHDRVQVCTKVGLAPPSRSPLMRTARAIARPFAGALQGLRGAGKKLPGMSNRSLPLDGALIERSLAQSLRSLRTDRIAVLALHDPDPDAVTRDDVLRALEAAVTDGQVRAVGIAGSFEACLAGTAPGLPYRVFQTAVDLDGATFAAICARAGRPVTTIGHSVMRAAPSPNDALRRTLAANPHGVTLLSMFAPKHLASNLADESAFSKSMRPTPAGWRTAS